MNDVFCNDLQPGTQVRITNRSGEEKEYTVRRYIPMQSKPSSHVADIEILLDKSKNIFFSFKMYIDGESWVKKIEILN